MNNNKLHEIKIIAYGPGKEAITWAGNDRELENIVTILKADGYDDFRVVRR